MSMVLILCEERFRQPLEALSRESGFHLVSPEEGGDDLAAAAPRLLSQQPDLVAVVSDQRDPQWIHQLDHQNVRYWLVEVGSPEPSSPSQPRRRPHRHLLGLDRSAADYLSQLLDDWRDRDVVRVDCFTFAYRDGLPAEADWVVDTRFLDSPYWIPEMRNTSGRDRRVREHVLAQPGARQLVDNFLPMLLELLPLYQDQRRSVLRVAVGCTGGKHRSVAIASELVERINRSGKAEARHLNKPPLHLPQALD